ncbi:fumarylacetoacetate hydrolase family protein [Vibrio lentus]|nr:fumarylacetoacetate hydrolase family protein [Vibrio lentus]
MSWCAKHVVLKCCRKLLGPDPLMYQGGSDAFIGPRDNIEFASDEWGIDFEGEVAIVTGDVPMGAASAKQSARVDSLADVGE